MNTMTIISPFLDLAAKISSVKLTETFLPIARKVSYVSPLVLGDDLELKSGITSPVGYDRSLATLLNRHSVFHEDEKNVSYDYIKFTKELSNIDKLSLIWAEYKSTYETLVENREIQCEHCNSKFKVRIDMGDLIHEDTYTIWDEVDAEGKDIPFTQYRFPIMIENGNIIYSFNTKLPSIYDNNTILTLIPQDQLQHNLATTGSVFTTAHNVLLLTDALHISSRDNSFEPVVSSNLNELNVALNSYVPYNVSEEFFNTYNNKFNKYIPKFYKEVACPSCKGTFKYNVNLENELFRRVLYGRESSSDEV